MNRSNGFSVLVLVCFAVCKSLVQAFVDIRLSEFTHERCLVRRLPSVQPVGTTLKASRTTRKLGHAHQRLHLRMDSSHRHSEDTGLNALSIPLPTPNRRCRFSVPRISKGLKLLCQCDNNRSEVLSEIIDGINHRCIKNCVHTPNLTSRCESGDLHAFATLAKSTRDNCCMSSCSGVADGGSCVRFGPFSSAQRSSSSGGCVVSFPVQPYGDQFACSCRNSLVVASPIMFSGIRKNCLLRCARGAMNNVCVPGRGRRFLVDAMFDVFTDCCEVCDGKALDGGLACGVRLSH